MLSSDRTAASEILRACGYSTAWLLNDSDALEVAFLVPRAEMVLSDAESQTLRLMAALPGRKVYIVPYRDGLPVIRLY
jgi:hypothetical protein